MSWYATHEHHDGTRYVGRQEDCTGRHDEISRVRPAPLSPLAAYVTAPDHEIEA